MYCCNVLIRRSISILLKVSSSVCSQYTDMEARICGLSRRNLIVGLIALIPLGESWMSVPWLKMSWSIIGWLSGSEVSWML